MNNSNLLFDFYASQLGTGAEEHHKDCGAACAAMLIPPYTGRTIGVDRLYNQVNPDGDNNLTLYQVANGLRTNVVPCEILTFTKLDIYKELGSRKPIISLINYAAFRKKIGNTYDKYFNGGHFVVIAGLSTTLKGMVVYINDPLWPNANGGQGISVPILDFIYCWDAAINDGNSSCIGIVPTLPIPDILTPTPPPPSSDCLYEVSILTALKIRKSPIRGTDNWTGRLLNVGDIKQIYAEKTYDYKNKWGAIMPDKSEWVAMIYLGNTYARKI